MIESSLKYLLYLNDLVSCSVRLVLLQFFILIQFYHNNEALKQFFKQLLFFQ
jgi:hypothetical protein